MKVVLHVCCAACTIEPFEDLAAQGHEVTAFFYNPNVHPLIEFRRRLKAQKLLQERLPVPVVYEEDYGLREWLKAVRWQTDERCADCYRLRLRRTARLAAERGADAVTTTLLGSTHQDHELVSRTVEAAARQAGVGFLPADWRDRASAGHERARSMNLYLQNYCGCIFSEWERFRDTTMHLYRGSGPVAAPDAG